MSATADVSRMLQSLQGVTERRLNAARKAFNDFAQMVVTNAKAITPVKSGDLKRSIMAEKVQVNGTVLTTTIGSGLNYAIFVHEIGPDKPHHKPPTQWKFLETAMRELDHRFLPYMRDAINGAG